VTLSKLSVLSVVLFMANVCAVAQAANEQGMKPYGSFHGGDLDQVNLSNGHLELRIPILSYPQRGGRLKLNFIVRYHNAVWNERENCVPTTSICFHFWEYDQQPGMSVVTEQGPSGVNQVNVGNLNSSTPISTFTIVSADESQHPLGNINGATYESLDGTGMQWNSSSHTITMSDGSRYIESNNNVPVLEDTNGNQITFNLGTAITDTMGRSIVWPGGSGTTQDFSGCTGSSPTSSAAIWTVPGSNGGTNTFKLCFTQVLVYTAHFTLQSTPTQKYSEPNGQLSMLQSIVLPDGTAWTFEYSQPNANGVNWGDLVKVILPTGGSINYTWGHIEGCHHAFGPPGSWSSELLERDLDANDGNGPHKWQYLSGQQSGQVIVRDPLNNDTVHTFTDLNTSCSYFETKVETYNGPQTGGTLVKTVTTDYSWTPNINVRTSGAQNPPPMNVVPLRTTAIWPNGQTTKIEFAYDLGFSFNSDWGPTFAGGTGIYGKETARREYDYGAGTPSATVLKATITNYWWQANSQYLTYNVLDVPSAVTVQDGSGNRVSQTTVSYDEAFPGASGISTSHDPNPANGNVRGNATTSGVWLSGSTVATPTCPVTVTNGFLTTTKVYLDTGLVSQSKDACGQKTTLQYSSLYAGTYLTSSCDALNHCTTMDYNLNTGSVASITDANGQITGKKTAYTYDAIGRINGVTYPDGGQANAFYPNATTVEVKKLQDATAGVWIDSYSYFDGLQRPKQTRLVDPEGDVYTETTYDALGRTSTVTNAHRNAAAPTDGITINHYDALGRLVNVTRPDGNVIQTNYSDPNVVTLVDETGRLRRETHDALGRLIKMEEPAGGTAGSKAATSVTINGTLQSKIVGGQAATHASATILISGHGACVGTLTTSCDLGTVTLTVGGASPLTLFYGGLTTAQTIAQGIASSLSSTQVTATASQVSDAFHWQVVLAAIPSGSSGNGISFSISQMSSYPGQYPVAYTFSSPSGILSGGHNAVVGTTLYDAGTVTLGLNGYSVTAHYGNGAGLDGTAAAVAADLVSQMNAELQGANPPFAISVPAGGAAISITWGSVGTAGNLNTITTSATTTQTSNFSVSSFAGCQAITTNPQTCNASLSGGTDPYSLDSSAAWPTLYSYDLLGNLIRVEQHGNTTDSTQWRIRTFQYDSLSRLTQSNNPEAGQLNFTYDADGGVVTRRDNRGLTIAYAYDPIHRLTQRSYSDSTPAESFAYDQTSVWGAGLSNTIGRLTYGAAAGNTAASVVSYDPMGRVTNEWVCLPSNCGTSTYSVSAQYDLVGHVESLTYPSGRTVTSGYSSAGRALNAVFSNFGSLSVNYPYYTTPQAGTPSSWGYNPNGSLHLGTFGNGISETYGFNSRGQLNSITASSSGQTWLSKLYGLYDMNNHNNGTIWSIIDGISAARNQFYQYDPVGRVTSGYQQDNAFNQTFNYDAWGNMSTSGTNNFTPLYDGNNRVSSAPANCTVANTYCYDAAGNMLNDAFHQYAYDGENRIKAVDSTGAIYTYGASGERIRKDTGGKSTEYIYFQGSAIAEKDVSSGYWSDYVLFNGRKIARANNFEHQLHISGQVCANCGWQYYQFNFNTLGSLAGRVIQSGDTMRWVQWNNAGSKAGMILTFTDGTESWTTGQDVVDQNGEDIMRGNLATNQWEARVANLTPVVGKTISQIRLYIDGNTLPGQWDVYYQDVVFTGADGLVQPLFSQNSTVPGLSGFGSTGMTQVSSTIHDCSGLGCVPMNTTTYFHADQIGSARLLSAGYGYPVWQGTFTPFGQEVSPKITTNHYKFNGKERGEATEGGLDYFGARYYSSVTGRWMTPDWSDLPSPIPYAKIGNPQSLNLYSYVTDDPLSHTDLDGHFQSAAANQSCPNNNGDSCKPFELPSCPKGASNCTSGSYGGYFEINQSTDTTKVSKSFYVSTTNADGTTTTTTTTVTATFSRTETGAGQFLGATAASNTSTYDPKQPNSNGPVAETQQAISFSDASKAFQRVGIPLGQVQTDSHPDTFDLGIKAIFKNPNTYRNVGDAVIMGVEGGPLGAAWGAGWAIKDLVDAPWGVLTH
jgi:RHS repeat-associated protein